MNYWWDFWRKYVWNWKIPRNRGKREPFLVLCDHWITFSFSMLRRSLPTEICFESVLIESQRSAHVHPLVLQHVCRVTRVQTAPPHLSDKSLIQIRLPTAFKAGKKHLRFIQRLVSFIDICFFCVSSLNLALGSIVAHAPQRVWRWKDYWDVCGRGIQNLKAAKIFTCCKPFSNWDFKSSIQRRLDDDLLWLIWS